MGKHCVVQGEWEAPQSERELHWRKHVAAWQKSRLSQAEYCRRLCLPAAQFSWWKHELSRRDGQSHAAPERAAGPADSQNAALFVPVRMTAALDSVACEVVLRNGRRLRLGSGADCKWVAALAEALEVTASC